MKTLEFFYDYVSVYSYLANSQLASIDAEIRYRPMFLGAVMEATGNRPPGTVEAKRAYLHKDMQRWAERYAVPLKWNPRFPQNTLAALRLAVVVADRPQFATIHQALFDAMWVHEADLGDEAVLTKIIGDAGLGAGELLPQISSNAVKQALKANTEEAVRRGAFGAPTFFVGDEMYFGNDRFGFIREAPGIRA